MTQKELISAITGVIAFFRREGAVHPEGREKMEPTARHIQLLFLVSQKPGLAQVEYVADMDINPASFSDGVRRLADELGWIEQVDDPDNKRIQRLYVSPKGQRLLDELYKELI